MKITRGAELAFVPASHEDPSNPGCLKRVLATRDDLITGRVMMVNWSRLPVAKSFQSHYHQDMQEVFVMISGEANMRIDDHTVQLSAGDAIIIDPNEVHAMINVGTSEVVYLVFGISRQQGGQTVVVD